MEEKESINENISVEELESANGGLRHRDREIPERIRQRNREIQGRFRVRMREIPGDE